MFFLGNYLINLCSWFGEYLQTHFYSKILSSAVVIYFYFNQAEIIVSLNLRYLFPQFSCADICSPINLEEAPGYLIAGPFSLTIPKLEDSGAKEKQLPWLDAMPNLNFPQNLIP